MTRRLILVVGVGRSGTSLLAGILGQLGFHLPQPEVEADDTNPRGFGEPRWVVDFHTRLLRARSVTVNDSRPAAWEQTATAADDPAVVAELTAWLQGELAQGDAVVVKDPRTVWFLPLWLRVAEDLALPASFVTMLRHPAEVLASAIKSYGTWQTSASRTAAWLNVALETERSTRGDRRAFIRYEDLIADWKAQITRLGEQLDLPLISGGLDAERVARVDAFVDPTLHRNRVDWDGFDVPPQLVALAEGTWHDLQRLAVPDGDGAGAHSVLDRDQAEFVNLYAEAEAIAQSSITAAKSARKRSRRAGSKAPPSLRARIARRLKRG